MIKNIWMIFPNYWEKSAGDAPFFVILADTKEDAEKIAYPPPWNVTMGVRALEAKRCHYCSEIMLAHLVKEGECINCHVPREFVD